MEKELNQEQLQQLAKCIKQLRSMMKKVDDIMCDIDEYDDRPLDCAWCTMGEAVEYLEEAMKVY